MYTYIYAYKQTNIHTHIYFGVKTPLRSFVVTPRGHADENGGDDDDDNDDDDADDDDDDEDDDDDCDDGDDDDDATDDDGEDAVKCGLEYQGCRRSPKAFDYLSN